MTLIEYLRKDEELIKMRKEWKEKSDDAFPVFNNDEFDDIESYKLEIMKKLKDM